jgi:hypothetical protein
MIGGNASRRDKSHVNKRHEILDWFDPSRGVIVIRLVLMYYAIEIGSSLLLLESFSVSFEIFFRCLEGVLDVNLSSLFIVEELTYRI